MDEQRRSLDNALRVGAGARSMSGEVELAIGTALGPLAAKVGSTAVHSAASAVMRAAGSLPIGNPPAMRAAAARLHDVAARTRAEADRRTDALSRCGTWHGPLRDRVAHQIDDDIQFIRAHATRLDQVAAELSTAAGRVEQAQHTWRARLDQLSADAAHRLRSLAH
jgi:hypothetical protein